MGKYKSSSPFDFVSIFVSFPYISLSAARIQFTVLKYGATCIAILTLTSPIDINAPTRDALVLVAKDSFVSLVTNLNKKTMFPNSDVSYYNTGWLIEPTRKSVWHSMNWNLTRKVG